MRVSSWVRGRTSLPHVEGHAMTITLPVLADPGTDTGRDRLGSTGKRGLPFLLAAATDGHCAVCGDPVLFDAPRTHPKRAEVLHLIASCLFPPVKGKGDRPGYVTRNMVIGCRTCNVWCGNRDVTAALPGFAYPEANVAWTPREVQAIGRGIATETVATDGHEDFRAGLDALL